MKSICISENLAFTFTYALLFTTCIVTDAEFGWTEKNTLKYWTLLLTTIWIHKFYTKLTKTFSNCTRTSQKKHVFFSFLRSFIFCYRIRLKWVSPAPSLTFGILVFCYENFDSFGLELNFIMVDGSLQKLNHGTWNFGIFWDFAEDVEGHFWFFSSQRFILYKCHLRSSSIKLVTIKEWLYLNNQC